MTGAAINTIDVVSKKRAVQVLSTFTLGEKIRVVFLSEDYSLLLNLKDSVKTNVDVHQLGVAFHDCIARIQSSFCEFSDRLNCENASEAFWGTPLASRNSADTPFLRDVVYCLCAVQIAKENSPDCRLVFVVDTPWVGRTLGAHFNKIGIAVRLTQSCRDRLDGLLLWGRLVVRVLRFLKTETALWFDARRTRRCRVNCGDQTKGTSRRIVLRSWFTRGSIDDSGRYVDRNFGNLVERLKLRGYDVWILPMFFNLSESAVEIFRRIRRSGENFVLTEDCLTPFTLISCLWREWRSLKLKLVDSVFEGIDFSSLIRRIHLERAFAPERLSYNRVYELLRELSRRGFVIDRFIYPFENNAIEKVFLCSVKRSYPNVEVVGFQHSVWYREQLGMVLGNIGLQSHPLPKAIVCSGRRYLDVLVRCGFPRERLRLGPSLRFASLYEPATAPPRKSGMKKLILIVLNFELNQCKELLQKTSVALRSLRAIDFDVKIKCHPLLSEDALGAFCTEIEFGSFVWAKGRVQDLVAQSDLVVMTYGSVSNLEVLTAGVPLLRISMDGTFDFDPLWGDCPLMRSESGPGAIADAIERALRLSELEKGQLVSYGRQLLSEYFEPESEDDIQSFVGALE